MSAVPDELQRYLAVTIEQNEIIVSAAVGTVNGEFN